jgi:hypothetical protein
MSTYTWRVLDPTDDSSTVVLVQDDKGIRRHLTLTQAEFCGLHVPARSERTLNAIMGNELAREKREKEEAKKKADEMSALRQAEIKSAKATWPGKQIVSHAVRVHVKRGLTPIVNVYGPTELNEEEQQRIAIKKLVAQGIEVPGRSDSSDSEGGYRSRRRSRRRGRKLRKQTRKH